MATVEVKGIIKKFGDVVAVDNIDLITEEGEFLVLLGPSGCGKTTLLRMIAGLEKPTGGEILIGDQVVTDLPPRTRGIAMVFQSYALYPHKTVLNNILFPLKAQGVPKELWKEKVNWAAKMFKIEKLLDRKPRELSGGERQRVALARAMVREPNVFLLDEPLSNLDAKLRTSAREELQQFQRNIGTTTIYVTHDQVEAMGLGDRVAVINKGKVKQIGTPHEIYHEPADTFVAGFLGTPPMNLINKENRTIGFRPEHFLPIEVSNYEDDEQFKFEVTWVEHLGSDRLVYGNVGSRFTNNHVSSRLPANVTLPIESGKTYTFVMDRKDLKFFDSETGLRADPIPL